MSQSQWNDFERQKRLGAGSFGTVYKVLRREDQRLYVIKEILMTNASSRELRDAINEVELLAKLDYEYIVR